MKVLNPISGQLTRRARWAEWLGRVALPPSALLSAVSGAFLTYDWTRASALHPGLSTAFEFAARWNPVVFFVFAITTFVLTVLQAVLRPRLMALLEKIDLVGENFRTLCDGMMADLAAKLAVVPGDETRVSVYVHDEEREFVLCGRYSPNPLLRKPGRPTYADDQGCISRVWQHGWWFENALGEGDDYVNATFERYNIAPETLASLSMRPRLIAGQRVDHGHDFIAVIIIESMREDRFVLDALRQELEIAANDYAAILKAFRAYTPRPALARKRGF